MRMVELRGAIACVLIAAACSKDAKPADPLPAAPAKTASTAGSGSGVAELGDIVTAVESQLGSYDRAAGHLSEEAKAIDDHLATAQTDEDRAAIKTALANTTDERTHLRSGLAAMRDTLGGLRERGRAARPGASEAQNNAIDVVQKSIQDDLEKLDKLGHDADEIEKRNAEQSAKLASLQDDADRATAKRKLDELRREKRAAEHHK